MSSVRKGSGVLRRAFTLVVAVSFVVAFLGVSACARQAAESDQGAEGDQAIAAAFGDQRSGVQVTASGTVERLLPDDTDGDRHQRFIVELKSGQTLLISHNIDIAPRIDALGVGDSVTFRGVYEWNSEGGVIHWTHHDPDDEHEPGWIDHAGVRYE